ncbi:MAG TPA: hypothetical protein DCQ96_08225, partial [Verrucomicrobiales bacterium]|nr:hypothetical protein [Verrucomicrobiales bacterium]
MKLLITTILLFSCLPGLALAKAPKTNPAIGSAKKAAAAKKEHAPKKKARVDKSASEKAVKEATAKKADQREWA